MPNIYQHSNMDGLRRISPADFTMRHQFTVAEEFPSNDVQQLNNQVMENTPAQQPGTLSTAEPQTVATISSDSEPSAVANEDAFTIDNDAENSDHALASDASPPDKASAGAFKRHVKTVLMGMQTSQLLRDAMVREKQMQVLAFKEFNELHKQIKERRKRQAMANEQEHQREQEEAEIAQLMEDLHPNQAEGKEFARSFDGGRGPRAFPNAHTKLTPSCDNSKGEARRPDSSAGGPSVFASRRRSPVRWVSTKARYLLDRSSAARSLSDAGGAFPEDSSSSLASAASDAECRSPARVARLAAARKLQEPIHEKEEAEAEAEGELPRIQEEPQVWSPPARVARRRSVGDAAPSSRPSKRLPLARRKSLEPGSSGRLSSLTRAAALSQVYMEARRQREKLGRGTPPARVAANGIAAAASWKEGPHHHNDAAAAAAAQSAGSLVPDGLECGKGSEEGLAAGGVSRNAQGSRELGQECVKAKVPTAHGDLGMLAASRSSDLLPGLRGGQSSLPRPPTPPVASHQPRAASGGIWWTSEPAPAALSRVRQKGRTLQVVGSTETSAGKAARSQGPAQHAGAATDASWHVQGSADESSTLVDRVEAQALRHEAPSEPSQTLRAGAAASSARQSMDTPGGWPVFELTVPMWDISEQGADNDVPTESSYFPDHVQHPGVVASNSKSIYSAYGQAKLGRTEPRVSDAQTFAPERFASTSTVGVYCRKDDVLGRPDFTDDSIPVQQQSVLRIPSATTHVNLDCGSNANRNSDAARASRHLSLPGRHEASVQQRDKTRSSGGFVKLQVYGLVNQNTNASADPTAHSAESCRRSSDPGSALQNRLLGDSSRNRQTGQPSLRPHTVREQGAKRLIAPTRTLGRLRSVSELASSGEVFTPYSGGSSNLSRERQIMGEIHTRSRSDYVPDSSRRASLGEISESARKCSNGTVASQQRASSFDIEYQNIRRGASIGNNMDRSLCTEVLLADAQEPNGRTRFASYLANRRSSASRFS